MLDLRTARLHLFALIDGAWTRLARSATSVWYVVRRFRWKSNGVEEPIPFDTRILLHHTVIKGKNGFLFHRDHDAIAQLTGRLTYNPSQLGHWMSTLQARKAWCDSQGIVSRFLIVPEKHVVYEDRLPLLMGISKKRPATQILAAAGQDLDGHILYPMQLLRNARTRRDTFYLTDTHWTNFGAFVAYSDLMRSLASDIGLETVDEDELNWTERHYIGDLGVRFDPEQSETAVISQFISPLRYRLVYQNKKFGRGAVHVYENARKDLPRCVLVRDSFSNFLIPYLMKSFSRLVAVSSLSCHYDLLEAERPDVTIFVTIERFLASYGTGNSIEMPVDRDGPTFDQFCEIDLDTVRAAR